MATAANDETTASKPRGKLPVVATGVLMLLVGAAIGMMVVGPMLGPKAAASEDATAEAGGHGPAAEGGALIFKLDGVIANPAGSRGQHHAIVTVAYQVTTAADEARLRGAEVQLRDAAGSLLERKTLEQLTAPGIRDQLRGELAALVDSLLVDGKVIVFLPQYIIQ
jgi:flagellar FliL protein